MGKSVCGLLLLESRESTKNRAQQELTRVMALTLCPSDSRRCTRDVTAYWYVTIRDTPWGCAAATRTSGTSVPPGSAAPSGGCGWWWWVRAHPATSWRPRTSCTSAARTSWRCPRPPASLRQMTSHVRMTSRYNVTNPHDVTNQNVRHQQDDTHQHYVTDMNDVTSQSRHR